MSDDTIDLLIIGAGPVGLTAALLFTKLGHSVRIVERRGDTQRAPAAHVVNARTFEVWRQMGLDVDLILQDAHNPSQAGFVHWVPRLGGEILGSLPYEQQGDDMLQFTPTPLRNLSQHRLEPALVAELQQLGVSVENNTTWNSCTETKEDITSMLTAHDSTFAIRSKWLLACDGASSAAREASGIVMEGPGELQTFVMIHFIADLSSLVGDHPGIIFWICDPSSGGTLVSHGGNNEWVLMHPDSTVRDHKLSLEECEPIVRNALVSTDVDISLLRCSTWTMTSQLADTYRKGRLLVAGDAAHRFPPTGGMGLNTGVQDVHNLAWKLSAVINGAAPESLLDSYGSERRPVAARNAQASLDNAMKMFEVFIALGIDPDPQISQQHFEEILASPDARGTLDVAIQNQATHFDMFGLQIGYKYELPASTSPVPELTDEVIRNFTPSSDPGNRLPHGWIEKDGSVISTLDLIPIDSYVSIAGPDHETTEPCLRVGIDFIDTNNWWANTAKMSPSGHLLIRPDQHIEQRIEQ
jgi:2-polyprenyl-6-methoxyphenol hydroxylase-like FAD-dependent oxidoreductase